MQPDTPPSPSVAYIVKAWPRLSETFILNEIIGLERRGVAIRIFSVRDPTPGPIHERVALVRANVTCLSLRTQWRLALPANFRSLRRHPRRYLRTLSMAIGKVFRHRHRHPGPPWVPMRALAAVRHFLRAGYLADMLHGQSRIHLHAHFASSPGLVALLTSRITGVPYTLTAHAKDIYVLRHPDDLRAKLREARAIVTCTDYNRKHLLSHYPQECSGKVFRIYHGLDLAPFRNGGHQGAGSAKLGESNDAVILSVARLVEKKGLDDLIAALAKLRRRGRSVRLEIIGGGPLRAALAAQAQRLGVGDHVRLLGAQPYETVCLAYRRAAVFVLPCRVAGDGDRDGIPNVLLEAVASGVPVVSTPVSGIPELIDSEHSGLLVEPTNHEMLADAIDRVLQCPELGVRLTAAARAKLEANFSLDRCSDRLLAVFRTVQVA
ncbi:MAG TPA: glycosyltransferase [Gemmatimonadales bacterium]|nr:glycosyltransferase [Gemmatimonadales bacterium]